jgi:nucleoside-diphosphate-sugar epimerase
MTILITGGSGFIGLGLSRLLLERGYQVALFDMVPSGKDKKGAEGVPFIRGNISDWAEVCNVIKDWKVDHGFHLAAMLSARGGFSHYFI